MLGSCARTFAGPDLLTVAPALFVALPAAAAGPEFVDHHFILGALAANTLCLPRGAPSSIWGGIGFDNSWTVCSE